MRALRFLPTLVVMGLLYYMSSRSPDEVPRLVKSFVTAYLRGDGTAHFLAYAVLAATIIWAVRPNFRSARWSIAIGWLVSSAYGAIDECHQLFVPERSASVWEFVIDSLGALVSCLVWAGVCFLLGRRRSAVAVSPHVSEDNGCAEKPSEATGGGRDQP